MALVLGVCVCMKKTSSSTVEEKTVGYQREEKVDWEKQQRKRGAREPRVSQCCCKLSHHFPEPISTTKRSQFTLHTKYALSIHCRLRAKMIHKTAGEQLPGLTGSLAHG